MSEAKHTPGPWRATKDRTEEIEGELSMRFAIVAPDAAGVNGAEWIVAGAAGGIGDEDEDADQIKANARLIAAAPELLAACKAVMEFLWNGTPVHPGTLVQAEVFNAIAKATGK